MNDKQYPAHEDLIQKVKYKGYYYNIPPMDDIVKEYQALLSTQARLVELLGEADERLEMLNVTAIEDSLRYKIKQALATIKGENHG